MSTVANKHDWFAEYDAKQAQLDQVMTSLRACSARIALEVQHLQDQDAPADYWRSELDADRLHREALSRMANDLLAETTAILNIHSESL